MEKVIWSIDSNMRQDDASINKVIRIAQALGKHVDILIDKRNRTTERLYWKLLTRSREFDENLTTHQEKLIRHIQTMFDDGQVNFSIHESIDDNYLRSLNSLIIKDSLLIVRVQAGLLRHPFFDLSKDFDCNILLLDEKPWPSTVKFAASVDPLHENDRPATLDHYIVKLSKSLKNKMKGEWQLVHCCTVSPLFLEHKRKIIEIHREALSDFARDTNTQKSDTSLIEGIPEKTLPNWVCKHDINILCVGYIARSSVVNYLVGSTTHELLKSPPCDMLMMHQS